MTIMMKADLPQRDDVAPLLEQLQAPKKPGALVLAEAACAAARKERAAIAGEHQVAITVAHNAGATKASDDMIRLGGDLELADQRLGAARAKVIEHRPALQEKLAAVMTASADDLAEAVSTRLEGLDRIAAALKELKDFAVANGISGPKQISQADRIRATLRDLRSAFGV
ncbi:hypothetical protein [Dongia sp.]|uniref:hypothetical protein n=1 Tax=Dongia sp. TaxID=1977262 RepID=UPI0037522AB1